MNSDQVSPEDEYDGAPPMYEMHDMDGTKGGDMSPGSTASKVRNSQHPPAQGSHAVDVNMKFES